MRGLHLVFLAVLLCPEYSLGLQCYSCTENKITSIPCQLIPCTGVCFKASMSVPSGIVGNDKTYIKGCAPTCDLVQKNQEQYFQGFSVQMDVSCCDKDQCNGGSRLQALASTGFLLSLGSTLLYNLF